MAGIDANRALPFAAFLAFGVVGGLIARAKGRTPALWLLLGVISGPIAMLVVWLLPSLAPRPDPAPARTVADEVQSVQEQYERGLLTDDEYEVAMARFRTTAADPVAQSPLGPDNG